jgi:hypothetical protein
MGLWQAKKCSVQLGEHPRDLDAGEEQGYSYESASEIMIERSRHRSAAWLGLIGPSLAEVQRVRWQSLHCTATGPGQTGRDDTHPLRSRPVKGL